MQAPQASSPVGNGQFEDTNPYRQRQADDWRRLCNLWALAKTNSRVTTRLFTKAESQKVVALSRASSLTSPQCRHACGAVALAEVRTIAGLSTNAEAATETLLSTYAVSHVRLFDCASGHPSTRILMACRRLALRCRREKCASEVQLGNLMPSAATPASGDKATQHKRSSLVRSHRLTRNRCLRASATDRSIHRASQQALYIARRRCAGNPRACITPSFAQSQDPGKKANRMTRKPCQPSRPHDGS